MPDLGKNEAPCLGPAVGGPGGPTQAARQTDFKFKIAPHKQKSITMFFGGEGKWAPFPTEPCALAYLSTMINLVLLEVTLR